MIQSEQTLFDIQDLDVRFRVFRGILPVLDRANISVHRSEKVGLVGETGCGKSITMKAAIGLLPVAQDVLAGQVQCLGGLLQLGVVEARVLSGRFVLPRLGWLALLVQHDPRAPRESRVRGCGRRPPLHG